MESNHSGFGPVDLGGQFTLNATASAVNPSDGMLDGQFGLPAEAMPPAGPVRLLDIEFVFPDPGDGQANCMVPDNQRVDVPAGRYATLFLVGTAVMGSTGSELTLHFESPDGTDELKEIVRFTDWCHEPQFGERAAIRAAYRYKGAGPVESACSLWMQPIFLPAAKKLTAITFGWSPNLRIFAATLSVDRYRPTDASLLQYLCVRLGARSETAAETISLYDTLLDICALRNDDELERDLQRIRGGLLGSLSVDDLFDHDAHKVDGVFARFRPDLERAEKSAAGRLSKDRAAGPFTATLVGHSHLDVVWIWPWNESVGKAQRTFARNVERLEKFPGATFAQSCPLFYEWMEDHDPALFDKIKRLVDQGRWELVGGMWVEPDGNMPCGEALVRQRLLGQRYFMSRFGRLSEVAWIPDTFGMHANHPQIIAKTGGKYFFTTKLLWNYENEFPFQHFVWEAPDGSRVLALQSAVGCGEEPGPHDWTARKVKERNPLLRPGAAAPCSAAAPELDDGARSGETIPEVLVIYGEGDGGEGPSDKMYQRAHTLSMLPEYAHGTVHGHFRQIEQKYAGRLPVWKDELYLENHRGTTTSQGRIKELNRFAEAAVLSAEKWACVSRVLAGAPSAKPALDRAWKKLLFNQFHDILPGTSIPQAYVDTEFDFDEALKGAGQVEQNALQSLAACIDTRSDERREGRNFFGTGRALLLFNPLAWERTETVIIPWGFPWVNVVSLDGRPIPSQAFFRDGRNWLAFVATVPAFGYTLVRLLAGHKRAEPEHPAEAEGRTLENGFYRVALSADGRITSIVDKDLGGELLAGASNKVHFFENRPAEWDNWNLDPEYDKHELRAEGEVRIDVLDSGPVTAALRVMSPAPHGGWTVQEIRLHAGQKRIDFTTDVDVRYRQSLVKAAFAFDIGAKSVKTEIGYGTYDRPTRPSTSFEKAKWEAWTQKWLDLSGPAAGVTLVNKTRYGFDVKGDRIRLTLVKGGNMPDPDTDLFTHRVEYALFSHGGDFGEAHAWRRGYEYNFPITALLEDEHGGSLPPERSLARISADNVCWEVLKEEEEGTGMVIRVYEVEGRDSGSVALTLPVEVDRAEEIDFLEFESLGPLKHEGRTLFFSIGHDEIKAIRVHLRDPSSGPAARNRAEASGKVSP